jgi:hypothetical protein
VCFPAVGGEPAVHGHQVVELRLVGRVPRVDGRIVERRVAPHLLAGVHSTRVEPHDVEPLVHRLGER